MARGESRGREWRQAVQRAVRRRLVDEHGRATIALELLADRLVQEGLAGDIRALREIGDRLDGRPAATLETPEGPVQIVIATGIARDAGGDGSRLIEGEVVDDDDD